MMILLPDLANAVSEAGLTFRNCGRGHYQVLGGNKLVNFYVTKEGSKIYVAGERKGRFVKSVAQVIEAAGKAKQTATNPAKPIDVGAALREELENRVTISLSRDVVSLGCDDRDQALRVYLLLERLAMEVSKPRRISKPCPGAACDGDCDDVSCDADK